MSFDYNGSDFLGIANLIYEIYDGEGEIKLFQYKTALELTSLDLKSAGQIQSALKTSYGTTRHVLSYLLENELLEIARKTRGGKEWYARTYKDVLAMVFDQLYRYIDKKISEEGIARAEADMVNGHCNLLFKAVFEQLEAASFDLRWKALAIAGLELVLEKHASNSYCLPRLCTCPDPAASASRKCEQCSLKAYSIDYALRQYFDPFSKAGIKSTQVSNEVRAIKRLIAPKPSKEIFKYASDFKRDFGSVWECARLFYTSDELFKNGKLNSGAYENKILSTFRQIISPIYTQRLN